MLSMSKRILFFVLILTIGSPSLFAGKNTTSPKQPTKEEVARLDLVNEVLHKNNQSAVGDAAELAKAFNLDKKDAETFLKTGVINKDVKAKLLKKAKKDNTSHESALYHAIEEVEHEVNNPTKHYGLSKTGKISTVLDLLKDANLLFSEVRHIEKNGLSQKDIDLAVARMTENNVDEDEITATKENLEKILKKQNELHVNLAPGKLPKMPIFNNGFNKFKALPVWQKGAIGAAIVGVAYVAYNKYQSYQEEKKEKRKKKRARLVTE